MLKNHVKVIFFSTLLSKQSKENNSPKTDKLMKGRDPIKQKGSTIIGGKDPIEQGNAKSDAQECDAVACGRTSKEQIKLA